MLEHVTPYPFEIYGVEVEGFKQEDSQEVIVKTDEYHFHTSGSGCCRERALAAINSYLG